MNATIQNTIDSLKQLRLPELRARYAEVFGDGTRCPNKTWIARKIAEAQAQDDDASTPPADEPTPDDDGATEDEQQDDGAVTGEGVKLSQLTVEELRQRYREVVGRGTGSSHKRYLIWKIRQAQKGRVPVGPRSRRRDGEVADFKILPLRMEAELVTQLDEARERLGLKSRMELFRRSLHAFLLEAGEVRVAEMFAAEA